MQLKWTVHERNPDVLCWSTCIYTQHSMCKHQDIGFRPLWTVDPHIYRHGQHVMIQLKDLVSPGLTHVHCWLSVCWNHFSDVLRGTYKGHIAGHSTRNGPWLWHSASICTCRRIRCVATNQLLMPADITTFSKATVMYVRIISRHVKDNGRPGQLLWMWMNVSINSTMASKFFYNYIEIRTRTYVQTPMISMQYTYVKQLTTSWLHHEW